MSTVSWLFLVSIEQAISDYVYLTGGAARLACLGGYAVVALFAILSGFKLLKYVGVTSTTISLKLAAFLCYAAGAFERLRAQDTFEISVDAFIIASAIFLASLFVPPRMLTVKYDNVQWVVVGGLSFLGAKYQTASRAFKELQQVPAECSGGQADAEKAVTMFIVTLLAVCSVATLCLRLAINGIVYDIADIIKFETVVPKAFEIAAKNPAQPDREVRLACRDIFRSSRTLGNLIPLIEEVLAAGEIEPPPPPKDSQPPAIPEPASMGDEGHRSHQ